MKIARDLWQFHNANPDVYRELCKLARELKSGGRRRYGMKGLFEVLLASSEF